MHRLEPIVVRSIVWRIYRVPVTCGSTVSCSFIYIVDHVIALNLGTINQCLTAASSGSTTERHDRKRPVQLVQFSNLRVWPLHAHKPSTTAQH